VQPWWRPGTKSQLYEKAPWTKKKNSLDVKVCFLTARHRNDAVDFWPARLDACDHRSGR
jgi:hypothetical protein